MIRRFAWLAPLALTLLSCGLFATSATLEPSAEIIDESPSQTDDVQPEPVAATPPPLPESTAQAEEPLPETGSETALPDADLATASIQLEWVVAGLDRPHAIANPGDDSGRLFVAEKRGAVRIVQGGELIAAPFVDISGNVGGRGTEQGLLGIAFHPDFASNGLFFLNYTDSGGDTVVSRFQVSAGDPNRADAGTESVVLTQSQPAGNHNGGHVLFGPDGYLYVGLGDGGAAGDVFGNGQNGSTWLGAMLRIDVSVEPYAIPPDNPFVGDPNVRGEIWAIGLRNPWRYAFDPANGDLYIADVGQNAFEEISVQPGDSAGGENYGWPITEGLHCFGSGNCDAGGTVLPVAEYDHAEGCSITGGFVYRGAEYPSLTGIYLYGDFCTGFIWGLARSPQGEWQVRKLLSPDIGISSFGVDDDGEIYVLDYNGGVLYRIIGAG